MAIGGAWKTQEPGRRFAEEVCLLVKQPAAPLVRFASELGEPSVLFALEPREHLRFELEVYSAPTQLPGRDRGPR